MRKSLQIITNNKKGSKFFYDILCDDNKEPTFCEKWNRKLDRQINWQTTFFKIKKIKEVKLKWFQIRIVSRIIATNKSLHLMKVKNTNMCTFCEEDVETIEHLFFECDNIQPFSFWNNIFNMLQNK